MAQPFRHPTSGIYYLRRKVPDDLRSALGREFKRSLKTRESREAKANFAAAWADSEQAFALARAQAKGTDILSAGDAQQLAARWFREEQERLELTRAFTDMLEEDGATSWQIGDEHGETHTDYTTLHDAAAKNADDDLPSVVHRQVEKTLRQHNLPVPAKGTAAYVRLLAAFDAQLRKLSEWALQRHMGESAALGDALPHQPLSIESAQHGPRGRENRLLSRLFDSYAQEKLLTDGNNRATRRSIDAYRAIADGFIELFGDVEARQIGRELVGDYRAKLAQLPAKGTGIRGLSAMQLIAKAKAESLPLIQEPTIRNRLRALSAVLSHGKRIGWLTENPVIESGVGRLAAKAATRRQAEVRKRTDYTAEELRAIFTSPVFTDPEWAPVRADFGKAWYWLPQLMYYTGARREELAQLRVADVLRSPEGIWHLSILAGGDEPDGTRTVKTTSSRRLVPLHPDLLARGLIEYIQGLPPDGAVFPRLKPNPAGYYGANFGKHWANYLREVVKLHSTASPSHGFRHTFKTLARAAGIPEDVHDAMTGHKGATGVARAYGRMPLLTMADELRRLPSAPLPLTAEPSPDEHASRVSGKPEADHVTA